MGYISIDNHSMDDRTGKILGETFRNTAATGIRKLSGKRSKFV